MPGFRDLPLELLPHIFVHIFKPTDLANLCLVNRQFYDFAIGFLYDQIYIYAWHRQAKSKITILFSTLAEYPDLAKRVHVLELRDFPKATFSGGRYNPTYEALIASCLKGLSNCRNLRSCTWTRDETISTDILDVLSSLPSLKSLEINGHSTFSYDPAALLHITSLERISLIMPSVEVVTILPEWIEKVSNTLKSFRILCKASNLITDTTLETLAPHMTQLQHLNIAGCPRVTHKGILHVISNNQAGIKSLGLEGLSQSFDFAELSTTGSYFTDLTSLTLTLPSSLPLSILSMTLRSKLEEIHLYTSASTKIQELKLHPVIEPLISMHGATLRKVSFNRIDISVTDVGIICSRCPNLESLYLVISNADLADLIPELAKSTTLRNIHINFPHIGHIGRISPAAVLEIAMQLGSQVLQLGFSNRVYQLVRTSQIDDNGGVVLGLELGPYEQPHIPEQFLVVKT